MARDVAAEEEDRRARPLELHVFGVEGHAASAEGPAVVHVRPEQRYLIGVKVEVWSWQFG
jgi:hypothetical protein